jgi:hypothetical protein
MGGITKVIFSTIAVFGCYINAQFINSKMIRSLYFLPKYDEDSSNKKDKLQEIFNNFKNLEFYKSISTIK